MLLPRRRRVPCWEVLERSGGERVPLCLVLGSWCLASGPSAMSLSQYSLPPSVSLLSGFRNEGAFWGVPCQAPAEGSPSPAGASGLCVPSPHTATGNVCLPCYVLSLRTEGIVRSPCLIGKGRGQRVALSSYVAEQGKRIAMPLQQAA